MYTETTEDFNTKITSLSRSFTAKLVINNSVKTITVTEGIRSINYSGGSCGADTLTIGGAVASNVEIEIERSQITIEPLDGLTLTLSIGLVLDNGTTEYIPFGKYFITAVSKVSQETIKISACDAMLKAEKLYVSNLSYPATAIQMIDEICSSIGISRATTGLGTVRISEAPKGYTCREMLGYLAALYGKFAVINRSGKLEIRWYEDNGMTADLDHCSQPTVAESSFTLDYIKVMTSKDESLTVGSGITGITVSNPFMTQDMINNAWNVTLNGFTYTGAEVNIMLADPRVDPWDLVTLETAPGKFVKVPCMDYTLKFDGGLSAVLKAGMQTKEEAEVDYKGPNIAAKERIYAEIMTINNLLADKVSAEYLQAHYLTAEELAAEYASIAELKAIKAEIEILQVNSITADYLETNFAKIDLANIKDGCITTAMIGTGVIGTTQIADGSITDAKIVGLTANKITAGKLDAAQIEVVNLNAANITVGTINGKQIDDGAINWDKLSKDVAVAVKDAKEQAKSAMQTADGKNSIFYQIAVPSTAGRKVNDMWFDTDDGNKIYMFDGFEWVDKPFGTNAIADAAITNAKIANLDAGKITTGTLDAERIAAGTITANHIRSRAITSDKIAAGAISAEHIQANTITSDKIVTKAITTDKIAASAITANEIAVNAVTTKKIVAGAVTANEIAAGAITTSKIQSGAVTAAKIAASAITAEKMAIGLSGNIMPYGLDTFEMVASRTISGLKQSHLKSIGYDKTYKRYGESSLKIVTDGAALCYVRFESSAIANDGIIPVAPDEYYVFSWYVRSTSHDNIHMQGYVWQYDDDMSTQTGGFALTKRMLTGCKSGWVRYVSEPFKPSCNYMVLAIYTEDATTAVTEYIDCLQLEQVQSTLQTASPWKPNQATVIDGGTIWANTIQSNSIAAGAITANKIAAGAVTASKISVTDLMALNATIGGFTIGGGFLSAEMEKGLVLQQNGLGVMYAGRKSTDTAKYTFFLSGGDKSSGAIRSNLWINGYSDFYVLRCTDTNLGTGDSSAYSIFHINGYLPCQANSNLYPMEFDDRIKFNNGIYGTLFTTSDERVKTDIQPLSDKYTTLFDNLNWVRFKYTFDAGEDDITKYHSGITAQNLLWAISKAGLTTDEVAAFQDIHGNGILYAVNYTELIAVMAVKIKQLENKILKLEVQINENNSN